MSQVSAFAAREPSMRPLGVLALMPAIASIALSWTYFLSPLCFLLSPIALALGFLSRSHLDTRRMGNIAIVLAALALVVAPTLLICLN